MPRWQPPADPLLNVIDRAIDPEYRRTSVRAQDVLDLRTTVPPAILHTPSRVTLSNMSTNETIEVAHNPEALEEEIQVNWNRLTVPGLSHQVLQYGNTNNLSIPLELWWDGRRSLAFQKLHADRVFLFSLCYPQQGDDPVAGNGPPRVLFVWPNMITLTCVMAGVKFNHSKFNYQGQSYMATATVTLEEIRDFRLLSSEVRENTTGRFTTKPIGADTPGLPGGR